MNKRRYHVNPATGAPGVCRNKDGNCPYSGRSGDENHYDTFGEAQLASQVIHSQRQIELPCYDERQDEFDEQFEEIKSVLETIQPAEEPFYADLSVKYEITTSNDSELLKNIIEGKAYVQKEWESIGPALQNPNLPREFINKVLKYPEDYHRETVRWVASNGALTHDEILHIVETSPDLYTRCLALRNPSLDESFAEDFVKNREDELAKLPWYSMLDNHTLDYLKLFKEYQIKTIMENIDTADMETAKINEKYPEWKMMYESRQKRNK